MPRLTLDEVKNSKNFYRNKLRGAIKILYFLYIMILSLLAVIFFVVLSRPANTFYATNSAGFISRLYPLKSPNSANKYLLKPNPPGRAKKNMIGL